jgi:molybdenum cofactor synthesis domain-containing protein
MAEPSAPSACLLVIGNEVLSGRTQDANLKYLGEGLNAVGVRLAEARVIPDDEDVIVRTLDECRARFDYVLTTGGIGPTHDDITAACVAKVFGVGLEINPEARALLETHYRTTEINRARLKMAQVPVGATLLDNPVSRAPGFQMGNVFVMAGVPRIMQAMFDGFKHRLAGGAPVRSRTVSAYIKEGDLAAPLAALQERSAGVEIGSYPFVRDDRFGVSIVFRSADTGPLEAAAEEWRAVIRSMGEEPQDGEAT